MWARSRGADGAEFGFTLATFVEDELESMSPLGGHDRGAQRSEVAP